VNGGQTLGVIELSEQTVIDQLVVRLTSRYPAISESTVSMVVRDIHAKYDGRPLRDFIPLFVERNAKNELERLGAVADQSGKSANTLRVYYVPPRWFLDLAEAAGLKVLVDIPWGKHLCFLDSAAAREEARQTVREVANR